MATQLDLQEQEQLDALKAFWKQYGNLITWTLILALGAFAAWNGWNWYQRDQAAKAGGLYDELDRAAQARDAEKATRVFTDLRDRYPGTAYAQQGALAAAKVQADAGKLDDAKATLTWVVDKGGDDELKSIARLRLAGIALDAKKYDEATKELDAATAPALEALVADRRGDLLVAQGKKAEAASAYQRAYAGLPESVEYRRLVEAKLIALGVAPAASAASGAGK